MKRVKPGPSRQHDPPRKHHLDEHGVDTRENREIKPLPGDHPARRWPDEHLDAGYHLQPWETVHADHPILGLYSGTDGLLEVRHLEHGHTEAPEYELEWENGPTVTVFDHTVVDDYLAQSAARRTRQRKDLARWGRYQTAIAELRAREDTT